MIRKLVKDLNCSLLGKTYDSFFFAFGRPVHLSNAPLTSDPSAIEPAYKKFERIRNFVTSL
jgi:hypothetical protein